MMPVVDEYRANAAECQRMAAKCLDGEERRMWLHMAAGWLRMAEGHGERSERFKPPDAGDVVPTQTNPMQQQSQPEQQQQAKKIDDDNDGR
jgi:hypothetical protein